MSPDGDAARPPEAGRLDALEGSVVLNLGVNVPAPVACGRLAEMGASVHKIEPPDGDLLEALAPAWYARLTSGQTIDRLDLKTPGDRARLDEHLAEADLLVTASRPSALERLGLAFPELARRFPRLLQVAIVGHPHPQREVPGHDLTYMAQLGLLSPPSLPRTLVADLAGAEQAVSTALGLLLGRERGRGRRYAEVALSEAAATFARPWESGLTRSGGPVGGGLPAYGFYEGDGGWIALAAIEPHFQTRLREELGLSDLDTDSLARAFRSRTPEEWQEWAQERGLPLAAVAREKGAP